MVRACRAHGVPFVPRGAGTGLSGGAIALEDGVVIECSRMNRILRVDAENRIAVVQPGVVNADLSQGRRPRTASSTRPIRRASSPARSAATWPRTPAARTRSSTAPPRTTCSRSSWCCRTARSLRLGSPAGVPPGYDLVGAVVGSEGTLGIVTELTVRLVPMPERVDTLLAIFGDVVSACRAVSAIIASGLVPAALEIVDQRTIAAVEASVYAAGLPTDAGAVLLVELDGPRARGGAPARARARALPRGGRDARWPWRATPRSASASGARARARSARWAASRPISTCTTRWCRARSCPRSWSASARSATATGCVSRTSSTPATATSTRTSPSTAATPTSCAACMAAGEEILRVCVEAGGVISGEHGIGIEKREYMRARVLRRRPRRDVQPARGLRPRARLQPRQDLPDARASAWSRTRRRAATTRWSSRERRRSTSSPTRSVPTR